MLLQLCVFFGIISRLLAQSHVAFDRATASSLYPSGSYSAGQALAKGSGYWCSSGGHALAQTVTWTGVLNVRRNAMGVTLNWAYGPGEAQILVSSDGGNFEEASCWRATTRSEVAYRETIMFERPQKVKAVSIVMKSPMPWGYFGLNDVALLTSGDESFMIVIGEGSAQGERCLTGVGSNIVVDSCLKSLASLDSREVFRFRNQRLVHVASGLCVAAAGDESYAVALRDCEKTSDAHLIRSVWQLTASAQLKLPRMGDSCLVLAGGRAIVGECATSTEKFFLDAVPETKLNGAAAVTSGAKLLLASAARQRAALNTLRALNPVLDSCRFVSLAMNNTRSQFLNFKLSKEGDLSRSVYAKDDSELAAFGGVYGALGVDTQDILKLISESSIALAEVGAKFPTTA